MQESVIYQDILQKGEKRGEQRGRQQGEATLIIRLLTGRFGVLNLEVEQKINSLSTNQLEDLGDALLDFSRLDDLNNYLVPISPDN
jgi:predicted transposase YdaD